MTVRELVERITAKGTKISISDNWEVVACPGGGEGDLEKEVVLEVNFLEGGQSLYPDLKTLLVGDVEGRLLISVAV